MHPFSRILSWCQRSLFPELEDEFGPLGEKHRKCGHPDLFHAVTGITAATWIRNIAHSLAQCINDIIKLECGDAFFEWMAQDTASRWVCLSLL